MAGEVLRLIVLVSLPSVDTPHLSTACAAAVRVPLRRSFACGVKAVAKQALSPVSIQKIEHSVMLIEVYSEIHLTYVHIYSPSWYRCAHIFPSRYVTFMDAMHETTASFSIGKATCK